MKKENYLFPLSILLIIIVGISMILCLVSLPTDNTFSTGEGVNDTCDTGKQSIVGDYFLTKEPRFKFLTNSFNRSCAVEDCRIYNDYQKMTNQNGVCVV